MKLRTVLWGTFFFGIGIAGFSLWAHMLVPESNFESAILAILSGIALMISTIFIAVMAPRKVIEE